MGSNPAYRSYFKKGILWQKEYPEKTEVEKVAGLIVAAGAVKPPKTLVKVENESTEKLVVGQFEKGRPILRKDFYGTKIKRVM